MPIAKRLHREGGVERDSGSRLVRNTLKTAEVKIELVRVDVAADRARVDKVGPELRSLVFRANEVRLQLSVLAYNLGNLWRRLVLPKRIERWSLTSLQQRLVKTGGRLVKHARYYWLLLAESHLTRRLFGAMLQRIWALPVPAG